MAVAVRRLCHGAILATAIPSISFAFSVHRNRPSPSFSHQYRLQASPLLQMSSSEDKSKDEIKHIDKLALILINSKREQLVARSYGKSVFYTPGGKREPDESDEEALIRECREELSVDLSKSTIEAYGIFEAQAYGKPEGTRVRITCYRVVPRDAELRLEKLVKASEEVEELKWINSSFDREKLTVTGIMILDDLKENALID